MGDTPVGIDGADLVELEIIHKQRLPAAAGDLRTAAQNINPDATRIFHRTARVGNHPDGPSATWCAVAEELQTALLSGIRNLDDTGDAIKQFLDDILRVDHDAEDRMNQHKRQMGWIH